MELEADHSQEYWGTCIYVKAVQNDRELCLVCMVDEDEDQPWERYRTKCKHCFHSRCIRRWCWKKQKLNCPLCGDIPEIEENMYCDGCKAFGHLTYTDTCPIVQREARELIELQRRLPFPRTNCLMPS